MWVLTEQTSLDLPEVSYWSRNLEQLVCLFHFAPFNHTLFLPPFTLPQWISGRAHDFLTIFNLWNSVQSRGECTMSQPILSPSGERKIGGKNLFSWPRLQYDHPEVLTGHYVPSVTVAYVQVLVIPWDKCGVILRSHVWVSDWSWMRFSLLLPLFSPSQSLPHSDTHPPSSSFLTTQSFMCLYLGVLT